MRQDKNIAFVMRRAGKSYGEIKKALGISKGTLWAWFKDTKWADEVKSHNIKMNRSPEHIQKMQNARKAMLEKIYAEAEKEAEEEFQIHKSDPLFMAGLMVYAGEGEKSSRNLTRISNSEFHLHVVFIRFSEKFLSITKEKIKVWLLLYPDHDIEKSIDIWSQKLGIGKENFNKSQVIVGREKSRKLQYGVGNSTISSTVLKRKMLKWLELCKLEFQ